MLGVLQWVSGEVWGEGSSSVLHSSALGEAAAFQCLVPPMGHVCLGSAPSQRRERLLVPGLLHELV